MYRPRGRRGPSSGARLASTPTDTFLVSPQAGVRDTLLLPPDDGVGVDGGRGVERSSVASAASVGWLP